MWIPLSRCFEHRKILYSEVDDYVNHHQRRQSWVVNCAGLAYQSSKKPGEPVGSPTQPTIMRM
ncbi:hypothetical protein DP643_27055 [Salmonella enterica]|nr:hypothetical protein [Salmonella enterica]EBN8268568.1 hypothetical protein [Salmonella enterica]EDX6794171.1 hypothetical protein [Salmonella enterica subsp. enterica serovar Sandiego]